MECDIPKDIYKEMQSRQQIPNYKLRLELKFCTYLNTRKCSANGFVSIFMGSNIEVKREDDGTLKLVTP